MYASDGYLRSIQHITFKHVIIFQCGIFYFVMSLKRHYPLSYVCNNNLLFHLKNSTLNDKAKILLLLTYPTHKNMYMLQ